jgi:hypothetical protein
MTSSSPVLPAPSVLEVEEIASQAAPVLRNLQITQCYCELSAAFARRTGVVANWCTFATWASRQAGQTIRKEDMRRTLDACLDKDAELQTALLLVVTIAKELGLQKTAAQLNGSILGQSVAAAAQKAAEAVSRGNKKVFEEIALQFARFIKDCLNDETYNEESITAFCKQLTPGPPPEGQDYLRSAFRHYYTGFFEQDEKRKAEWCFLANLEIGNHEQTRLQPEILEALNAGTIDPNWVKSEVHALIMKDTGFWKKLYFLFKRLFGKTAFLDEAIAALSARVQELLRRLLTADLMTLTLPDKRLQLGKDLTNNFPEHLVKPANADLLSLLHLIDPTPDSVWQSGAADWADLKERLHFIADLFRCFQEDQTLFSEAFTPVQVAEIKSGNVPAGRL